MFLEHGADFQKEVGLEKGFVRALVRPGADEAEFIPVAQPVLSKRSYGAQGPASGPTRQVLSMWPSSLSF
jgi:hypothetical protein